MKLIKTKEENLEENYLELHYDKIDEETKAVLDRLRDTLRYIEGTYEEKKSQLRLRIFSILKRWIEKLLHIQRI